MEQNASEMKAGQFAICTVGRVWMRFLRQTAVEVLIVHALSCLRLSCVPQDDCRDLHIYI